MQYEIHGTTMPSLDIQLEAGESVYTEAGGMAWMTDGIDMKTSGKGGLGQMLGRALAGESLFLTTYTAKSAGQTITFTMESMGSIRALNLPAGQTVIAQRDAFMCAQDSVSLEMHFRRKIGSGLFGGEGFIMQKLTGPGLAFVEIVGDVREYTLQAGQIMKVDPGHVAMFEPTVSYEIEMVKGITNIFLGGEGLFLATLNGPGRVWLQTMPLQNMARAVSRFIPKPSSGGSSGDIGGKIIKGILDNI